MNKSFVSVFPILQLNTELKDLFEDTDIIKVSASKSKRRICIYIESTHLIPRLAIHQTETEIKKQLFAENDVSVRIVEHFSLSGHYTPKALMDVYYNSIIMDLGDISDLEANLFHKAEKKFLNDNQMQISITDNFIMESKMQKIRQTLTEMFEHRFDMKFEMMFFLEDSKGSQRS